MTISIQICVWLFYWGALYSSTIKQSTTLTLKAFKESDIKQNIYKTYTNLFMADHASQWSKGSYSFGKCKYHVNIINSWWQNHYIPIAITIVERNLWSFRKKQNYWFNGDN